MAISVAQVQSLSDRRFFVSMAFAMAMVTLVGFGPTYFFAALNSAPTPVLTPVIHVHGGLCTAWVFLLIVQTTLVAAGRRDIHRRMGVAGGAVAAAVVVSGLSVALHSHRRIHTDATADTLADPFVFLIFPMSSITLFAVFATLGILKRRQMDSHKRFMLLATSSLIIPALARIVMQANAILGVTIVPGVVGAAVLVNGFLIAMAVHDFHTRGRLHPVTLWGGGFLLLSEPLRFLIGFSGPWQEFARSVMG